MRMIITMISIVIIVPILFIKLARDYPQSSFFRNFIWIVILMLIFIFLSAIGGKKSD
jgi:ABC-type multidrug transport system permease subunit